MDEFLLCIPPAASGLSLGLWLGERFSRWASCALAIGIFMMFGLLVTVGETMQWLFWPIIIGTAALGGFLGPAVGSKWWVSIMVSGLAAPTITVAAVYAGFTVACGVWGGCL